MQTKSFLRNTAAVLLLILMIFGSGCKPKKEHKNLGNYKLQYYDLTGELSTYAEKGAFTLQDLAALKKKHGRVFQLWLNEILDYSSYGFTNDTMVHLALSEFIERNKPVFRAVKKHYAQYSDLNEHITEAFATLDEVIGGVKQPVIYNYFSQFSNYNTFIDTANGRTVLAYSSEMFMNDTFILYKILEVPEFFNRYNNTDQIPAMLVWNYLKGRFESEQSGKKMIDEAVFQGKIWYIMEKVFGEDEIWKQFGYTEEEWRMMLADEGQIWRNYLNNETLFSTDFNEYKRFFAYGKYTYGGGVPENYPPLLGNFTGYRIVSAYMEKTEAPVSSLMKLNNGAELLRQSAYNPIK